MQRQHFTSYGTNLSAGAYLRQTRQICADLIQPQNRDEFTNNVTACILDKFTQIDLALFNSRQYILTLWPAFVGAIVAIAPDPANIVFDNVWWAALFAITCGGLPGLDNSASPFHHTEAHSDLEGRSMCESFKYDASRPKALTKSYTKGPEGRDKGRIRMEWGSFFLSFGLWVAFIVYFGHTLYPCIDFSASQGGWLTGGVWYYISASPAVLAALFELAHNRVDLYELVRNENDVIAQTSSADEEQKSRKPVEVRELPHQRYQKVKVGSVFSLWMRIAIHQWRRDEYRILIRDGSAHAYWWVFLIGKTIVGIGRVTIFAYGSVLMGNILFMPVPDDVILFVLLLLTTAIPRQLWPAFWTNGNRGADLVVYVRNIQLGSVDVNDRPRINHAETG